MSKVQAERREYWQQWIAKQAQSGQSVRAFCQERSIGEHSFYMWRQRLREGAPVRFALVEARPIAEPAMLELLLASGDRLRIPADLDHRGGSRRRRIGYRSMDSARQAHAVAGE